ncbi:hypothetical protein B4098_0764 [Heyndrickxia coagulans]|uniref:Uncharacterized protein n=1 Tax=Heyndrickxia coagulans TaxID=1398 RepID=A0A150JU19_HEYCO|nr:hypothetical protein B4098_0764 [Heyndrickxia coagulans]
MQRKRYKKILLIHPKRYNTRPRKNTAGAGRNTLHLNKASFRMIYFENLR